MEKGTNKKTFVSVGKIGLIALAGWALYKLLKNSYKNELETLVEAKEQENKKIESLGVSPERMRSQVFDCEREADRNMVKAIYVGMEAKVEKNSDYTELIDLDGVLSSKAIVRVLEERGGYKGMTKYLIFLFEIPDSALERGVTLPLQGSETIMYCWNSSRVIFAAERWYISVSLLER